MNSYLTRKNARIAAERAGCNMPDVSVHQISRKNFQNFGCKESEIGRFIYINEQEARQARQVQATIKQLDRERAPVSRWDRDEPDLSRPLTEEEEKPVLDFLSKFNLKNAKTVTDGLRVTNPVPTNTLVANLEQSTVKSPVKLVHDIANSMPGARRKDVVAACVEAGVALNTARTQYQVWFRNRNKIG